MISEPVERNSSADQGLVKAPGDTQETIRIASHTDQ